VAAVVEGDEAVEEKAIDEDQGRATTAAEVEGAVAEVEGAGEGLAVVEQQAEKPEEKPEEKPQGQQEGQQEE